MMKMGVSRVFPVLFYILLIALNPLSVRAGHEPVPADPGTVYDMLLDSLEHNRWEEARDLYDYLQQLVDKFGLAEDYPDLPEIEGRMYSIRDKNIEVLYRKSVEYTESGRLEEARKLCWKILHYRDKDHEAEKLLQRIEGLMGIEKRMVSSPPTENLHHGLLVCKKNKIYKGYTVITHNMCGQASLYEHPVYLIDDRGRVVYKWMVDAPPIYARLLDNGHLAYIDGSRLYDVDSESMLIWSYGALIDHSFQWLGDGMFLINRYETPGNDATDEHGLVKDLPCIEIINRKKEVLWQWRGVDHLEEIEALTGISILPRERTMWANDNFSQILPDNLYSEKDRRFRKGNILFSFEGHSVIGIIDRDTKEVVWAWGPGVLSGQHTPAMLANGHILMLDNGAKGRGWTRVIELDPLTGGIVWEYRTEPKEALYCRIMGSAVRLPNGNTFICDSSRNRLFEVTPDGEVVWDFVSKYEVMDGTGVVYYATKYPPEKVKVLLEKKKRSKR